MATEHRQTEAALQASGVVFTILRNGWYTENYTGSIGGAMAGGAFIASAGDGKISSASRAEYALGLLTLKLRRTWRLAMRTYAQERYRLRR